MADTKSPLAAQFGARLRSHRSRIGISQEGLGFRTSLHRTEIGLLERGLREPRLGTIIKLAGALGVSVSELTTLQSPSPGESDEKMRQMDVLTPREVPKPWGSELWFAHSELYAGKILRVRAGYRLSIQYHEAKDETSYVLSGRVMVSQGDSVDEMSTREYGPGETWRNPPLLVHSLEALEDSEIIEVSTPQVEDVVRLEDRYGRVSEISSSDR